MLIEYKLKFEKNGLTLTQRVEPEIRGTGGLTANFAEGNWLRASHQESQQANAAGPRSGSGPGDPIQSGNGPFFEGAAPVTFIGPFIICCPHEDSTKKD